MKILDYSRPKGITLLEALFGIAILAIAVIGIIQGMNMGYNYALRSRAATEAQMLAVKRMEDIMALSYDRLDNATYPVEYVTQTQTIAGIPTVTLLWTMTTTVSTVTSPACKHINLSVTWRKNSIERNTTYFMIKSP